MRGVNAVQNRGSIREIPTENKFEMLSVENESERRVLLAGDSNIRRIRNPILDKVKQKNQVKIVGQSGAKISECERMISAELKRDEKIKQVIVCAGTNDVEKLGSQVLLGKLRNLVKKIKDLRTGVDVKICTLPSRVDKGCLVYSRSESVNCQLDRVCKEVGATAIDLRPEMNQCRYPLTYDGVHYSRSGAKLVGHRVGVEVETLLG